jgi:hypothetical protein
MPRRFLLHSVVLPVLLSGVSAVDAQDARGPGGRPGKSSDSTLQHTAVTPQSHMQIRVYEGFGTLGPLYDHRGVPPYAVDVGVGMTTCPDGNTEISGLNIGGWHYQLGAACQLTDAGRATGSLTVRQAVRAEPPPADASGRRDTGDRAPPPAGGAHVIRCNPNTWNCGPVAR